MTWCVGARRFGKGRRKVRGELNRTEKAYEAHLSQLCAAGEVSWWKYEGINFELAPKTFWRPDFVVLNSTTMELEVHEVKAKWKKEIGPHIEAAGNVKIKVFAELYPLRCFVVWQEKGNWQKKEY